MRKMSSSTQRKDKAKPNRGRIATPVIAGPSNKVDMIRHGHTASPHHLMEPIPFVAPLVAQRLGRSAGRLAAMPVRELLLAQRLAPLWVVRVVAMKLDSSNQLLHSRVASTTGPSGHACRAEDIAWDRFGGTNATSLGSPCLLDRACVRTSPSIVASRPPISPARVRNGIQQRSPRGLAMMWSARSRGQSVGCPLNNDKLVRPVIDSAVNL